MTESAVRRFIVSGVVPAAAHLAPRAVTLRKTDTFRTTAPGTPAPETALAMGTPSLPPGQPETAGQRRTRTTAGIAQ